ncbi:MAG: hypothetical protein ACLGIA_03630 [Actinomycetes bacterium]
MIAGGVSLVGGTALTRGTGLVQGTAAGAEGGPSSTIVLAVVLVLGVVAWYLASCAARLDRLHHRVESAAAALDNQLLRRASASRVLANSGLLDPATALLLAGAAAEAICVGEDVAGIQAADPNGRRAEADAQAAREAAESDLTRALRATLTRDVVDELAGDPFGRDLLGDLQAASQRASLARRFLNDAVAQARRLRGKRLVRLTRLAGRAPWPQTFEMDDDPPDALER